MSRLSRWAGASCACVAAAASAARAEPAPTPEPVRPASADFGLTGDWGGLRTRLADSGLTISGGYGSQVAYNLQGGERRDVAEAGQFDIGLMADLDKLAGIRGGAFKITVTDRRGKDLGRLAGLRVLEQVQEIYGRGQTLRLTQLWYEQKLGPARLKLGRGAPGEDFASFSCQFENLGLCGAAPGNLVGDYWYNWPVSQWEARLRLEGRQGYVQAGVYEFNPRNLEKGFNLGRFHGAKGALIPIEARWTPQLAGRPSSIKIGMWWNTADGIDLRDAARLRASGEPGAPQEASRSGMWMKLQQQLSPPAAAGAGGPRVTAFLNMTQADRRTARMDQQISTGLFVDGPFPNRPRDEAGVGVSRTHLNPGATGTGGAEYSMEAYYMYRPRPGVSISPNVQVVRNPGGISSRRAIVVLGLKTALRL